MEQLMKPSEVAEVLGVPVATLYNWRLRHVGPPALKIGRHLRYCAADLKRWVDHQAVAP
jgi:excisionase family DNA binding protein